jgi:serine/threonine-protein kinase
MMQCPSCGARYADSFKFCGADGAALTPIRQADPLLGHVLAGSYRIQEIIGSGGYGTVYKAAHERLPTFVAIKVLSKSRARDDVAVARFKREVEAEAVISHPHIVKVLDYGHDALAGYFIVMEHMVGRDLGGLLEAGQLPHILDTFAIASQTGSALGAAHRLGIVHRDVKADNVFLVADASEPQGFSCKLLDFGVAKLTRPVTTEAGQPERAALHSTQASTMLGSPCTVCPELLRGHSVDHRADIYSFGAMLYEMLTGEILFATRSVESMLERIIYEAPTPPSRCSEGAWVPPELDDLLLAMLAKRPEDRPQAMADVLRALDRLRPQAERAWAAQYLAKGSTRPLLELDFRDEDAAGARAPTPVHTDVYQDWKPIAAPAARIRPLVLVVDDDRAIRGIAAQLVLAAGMDCEPMAGGREAMAWIAEHGAPDAMVLDLLMPGLDGIAFLRELRARGWHGPVVVCSGVGSAALRAQAEAIAGVRFLDKISELHRVGEALRGLGVRP